MDVAEMQRILMRVREILAETQCVSLYAHWDDSAEAIAEIDEAIAELASGSTQASARLSTLFAPAFSLQDTSIDCGWSEEFLRLAECWDAAIG